MENGNVVQTITNDLRDHFNSRLNDQFLGLSETTVYYINSKDSLKPLFDELKKDGWAIKGFTDQQRKIESDWASANVVCIERKMKVTLNRNDGTKYSSSLVQCHYEVIGNECVIEEGAPKIILDDNIFAMALCILAAKSKGPKPSNFIEDL